MLPLYMMYTEIDNSIYLDGVGDSDRVEDDHDNPLDSEDDWSSDWTVCREFDCLLYSLSVIGTQRGEG